MGENFDVPDLSFVIDNIFSTCDTEGKDAVLASTLLDILEPHIINHPTRMAELRAIIDPLDKNPLLNRTAFYEAMKIWAANLNESDGRLSNLTFGESDNSNEKDMPFRQSTPNARLTPSLMENISDFSNVSPTSCFSNFISCNLHAERQICEQEIKKLEHKYMKAQSEICLLKSQLASTEEQYAELKMDLDRTNKRLTLEQQVNADLQKSKEHNNDFKEQIQNSKKEIDHFQKIWSISKKENCTLLASLQEVQFEKEQLERKVSEVQQKDESTKKVFADLQMTLSVNKEQIRTLKQCNDDLLQKNQDQANEINNLEEMIEIIKAERDNFQTIFQKYASLKNLPHSSILDTPPTTSPTNAVSEYLDDFDLSTYSEAETVKAQDLRTELQDCKFWDNSNKCYNEDHGEWSKIIKDHENCSKIINECQLQIELLRKEIRISENHHKILVDRCDQLGEEKEVIVQELDKVRNEAFKLSIENNSLLSSNSDLINQIDKNKLRANEIEVLKSENEILENKITSMKNEQEINCHEVDTLTKRLEYCKDLGKSFVNMMKKKLLDQNKKVECLNQYNKTLEERVEELKAEIETTTTNFLIWRSADATRTEHKCLAVEKSESEDSTSTGASETISLRKLDFRNETNYVRTLNYEKQQVKINKLEEHNEKLKRDLQKEIVKSQKVSSLECELLTLELRNKSFEEEKKSLLRELETTCHDLHIKEMMLNQFEEKYKFEMDNLNAACRKEIEEIKFALSNAEKAANDSEVNLKMEIDNLQKSLGDTMREKKRLEKLLGKQENNIISLKKALSDLSTSSEEGKNFGDIVKEKESMLTFNRELLAKSNNSLLLAENKIRDMEALLDTCKMVIDSAGDVFRSAKLALGVWKNALKTDEADNQLIDELKSVENITDKTVSDFTEQDIWKIRDMLLLSATVLKELTKKTEKEFLCNNELDTIKGVNKFTLKPSKLKYCRQSSSIPVVSSSFEQEEIESQELPDPHVQPFEVFQVGIENEQLNDGSKTQIKVNDSVTDWVGQQTENIREALKDRQITEKKFYLLASSMKLTYENAKSKYYNFKHRVSKLRESYLRILLQLVTYIKNHKCHQEQKNLIQALKLVEKLKDLLFDVFKLAEQYGASRQELQSLKCWNLIVEYVNGLHQENKKLKLFQCTSSQTVKSSNSAVHPNNVFTQTENSIQTVGVGDFDINDSPEKLISKKDKNRPIFRKCKTFMIMFGAVICLFAIGIMFVHLECIKNSNKWSCPLDFLISIKRHPDLLPPY